MTEKKTAAWATDADGAMAYIPAGEMDAWVPRGWTLTADPAPGDLVWLQHEDHGGHALFAYEAVAAWEPLGWRPSAPPEPVDLLHDQHLVDPAVAEVTETPKKAASGSTKEK